MSQDKIRIALQEQAAALEQGVGRNAEALKEFSRRVAEAFHGSNKLLLVGGGALGSVANLVASRFVHRMNLERPLLPAVSLCHDSTLTSALNADGQASQVFARQIRALAGPGDIVLIFEEGRHDESLERALAAARQVGCFTAALLQGREQIGEEAPDSLFVLEGGSVARTAECALFFGHMLVELVENEIFGI